MSKLLGLIVLLPFIAFSQIPGNMLPTQTAKLEIVQHTAYTLAYNEPFEQASWVIYKISKQYLDMPNSAREPDFKPDHLVKTGSATSDDYKGSGYDRGHLAPAADMNWSEKTMFESFYMSNVSPQVPLFNRGVWKRLEDQGRDWAALYGVLWVVDGPILKTGLPKIGTENKVSVPKAFYKVLYDSVNQKMIGFILPNESSKLPLKTFVVPVDSIEKITKINFFPKLSAKKAKLLESQALPNKWMFKE